MQHGIVRGVKPGGRIWDCTFKNGEKHGLCRTIDKDKVSIELWKNGHRLSNMQFDCDFNEIARDDDDNLLSDLTAEQFRLSWINDSVVTEQR